MVNEDYWLDDDYNDRIMIVIITMRMTVRRKDHFNIFF